MNAYEMTLVHNAKHKDLVRDAEKVRAAELAIVVKKLGKKNIFVRKLTRG